MQSPAIPPSTERREGVVIETDVNLKPYNTFGLPATARRLVRIREELDVRRVVDHPELGRAPKFVRRYGDLRNDISKAVAGYADDVRARRFPGPAEIYFAKAG